MKLIITSFFAVLIPLLLIDFVWLTTMSKNFYNKYIGHILAESPNLIPAGFFYLIYSFGIVFYITKNFN